MASGSAIWMIWNAMVRFVTLSSHFCHSDVTLMSQSDICHFIDTFTDNIQSNISVYYNSSWKTEVFCTQLQITFMFACKRLYLVSKMDCYKCHKMTLFSVSKVSIRKSDISAHIPELELGSCIRLLNAMLSIAISCSC